MITQSAGGTVIVAWRELLKLYIQYPTCVLPCIKRSRPGYTFSSLILNITFKCFVFKYVLQNYGILAYYSHIYMTYCTAILLGTSTFSRRYLKENKKSTHVTFVINAWRKLTCPVSYIGRPYCTYDLPISDAATGCQVVHVALYVTE
jgi:hypothetical protein